MIIRHILATALIAATAFPAFANCGGASWYALPGNRTANGERMNPNALTAAHKTLRFGTKVRVTNSRNGKSVIVRINDRGPFVRGRIIDLSRAAAEHIGMRHSGTGKVCINGGVKSEKKKIKIVKKVIWPKKDGR